MVVGDTVALQCKALGSPPPRITWLCNDQPLRPSDRHHFTPGNQLLVISPASMEDTGRYTCLMSNTLGTARAHSQLMVSQLRGSCSPPAGLNTVTIGIIVIAVVTSIVVTSLVWVCIIYQTRKKSEECSVTNTGELALTTGGVSWRRQSCFKRLVLLFQMRPSFLQMFPATSPPRARCPSGRTCASAWRPAEDLNPTAT